MPSMEYVSLFISIIALGLASLSLFETRKNNRLGLTPEIVGNEIENPTEWSYSIKNSGNGPALIDSVEYFYNYEPIAPQKFKESVRKFLSNNEISCQSSITLLAQKGVIAVGETIQLAKLIFPPGEAEKFNNLEEINFGIKINYRAPHGQPKIWVTDEKLKGI